MRRQVSRFDVKISSPMGIMSLEDFEEAYRSIRSNMVASGQFANPDTILHSLLELNPGAASLLQQRRIRPDNIRVVRNHRSIIKSVNSKCWSYATLNAIFTLQDLYKLIEPHIDEIGPICSLPFIQQIFNVREFKPSVVAAFSRKELNEFRWSTDILMDRIAACINENRPRQMNTGEYSRNKWWESVIIADLLSVFHAFDSERSRNLSFDDIAPYGIRIEKCSDFVNAVLEYSAPDKLISAKRRMELLVDKRLEDAYSKLLGEMLNSSVIADFKRGKPQKVLHRLSRQCSELHDKLKSCKQFHWPHGALESLHRFGAILNSVLSNVPFPGLLRFLIGFKYVSEIKPEAVLRDLKTPATEEGEENSEQNPEAETAVELTSVVQKFNDFLESLENSDDGVTEVTWQNLANLEKDLGLKKGLSLLAALAKMSSDESKDPRPKCLNLVNRPQRDHDSRVEEVPVRVDDEILSNVCLVEQLVTHVTFYSQRSIGDLLELVGQRRSAPTLPALKEFIEGTLKGAHTQSRFLIHPRDTNFLDVLSTRSSLPVQLTDRSAVLSLLASCPVLEDPEIWTLWCLPPSSNGLACFWGSLENFLLENEIDETYNLAVVKLENNGYIRLTVNGSLLDLETAVTDCLSTNKKGGGRTLCDLLIGSSLLVNRNIPPKDSIRAVAKKVGKFPVETLWCQLVRTILLITPSSLLGVLVSKILQPALGEVLIVMAEEVDGLESLLNSTEVGSVERERLVTAIGVVGAQLGWPHWLEVFKIHRLSEREPVTPTPPPLPPPPRESVVLPKHRPPVSESQNRVDSSEEDEIETFTSSEKDFDRREFIEHLRREEFGLGVSLDPDASEILQRFQSRLGRSLKHLSGQLYGEPGHFILELIQNADDNVYEPGTEPCIHFSLSETHLTVCNNEEAGFSTKDIAALCDVGRSTKLDSQILKIGRKGIGFKSVFSFSDAPEVHSNGFHVRFRGDGQSMLIPEWISEGQIDNSQWTTTFRLPFNEKVMEPHSVVSLASNLLTHHLILFLKTIKCIEFKTAPDISNELNLELRREIQPLFVSAESELKLVTVYELRNGRHKASQWLFSAVQYRIDCFGLPSLDSKDLPDVTEISIAIPLSTKGPLPTFPVCAFLPVRNTGFQFLLNADFDLTSSREDVDGNSEWNRFLVNRIPSAFGYFVTNVIEYFDSPRFAPLPLSQSEILGRILDCLPFGHSRRNSFLASPPGIFAKLGDNICYKLTTLAWIPVRNGYRFAPPNNVLLTSSQETTETESVEAFLIRLLVERAKRRELDPALLSPPTISSKTDSTASEEPDWFDLEGRIDKLLALGAQRISADSLIELAPHLSPYALLRDGMLYALLTIIDKDLRSPSPQGGRGFMSLAQISAWKRRCLRRLSSLKIFPLDSESLVSLDTVNRSSDLLRNRNQLLIPPRFADDTYVELLSDLGPLICPLALSPSSDVGIEIPRILTAAPEDYGLGIKVADSVEVVKENWIAPHQSHFRSIGMDNSDWFIAAAKLLVIHSSPLDEELVSCLPIVCQQTADGPKEFFNPKIHNAVLPSCLVEHLPVSEEYEILSLVRKELLTVELSPDYFQGVDSETVPKLVDWLTLAGIFALRKIQPQKYRLGESPIDLPLLPEVHALRSSPALADLKNPVVVDWLCPGLEDLVLPWIKTESEKCAGTLSDALKTVCEKLAAFLYRHWKESFSSHTEAIAIVAEDNEMTRRVPIGAASWLRSLRECRWLLVENADSSLSLATAAAVYAPSALQSKPDGRPVPRDLLAHVCPVWKALEGMNDETSVQQSFLSAIGVKQALDEGTFEDLMAFLRKTPDNKLPSALTIESMLQVYKLGSDVLSRTAMRRTFGSSIVIPCCDRKLSKCRRTIDSSPPSHPCPSCPFCEAGRMRASPGASGASFHVVPAGQTCWRQARLPDLEEDAVLEDDNESEGEEEEEEEEVLRVPVVCEIDEVEAETFDISNDQIVPLCDIYGSEWREFFCVTLGVKESPSLEGVLALRPNPPLRADCGSIKQWRSAQHIFGRRLATWYALIYSLLGADISKEVTERLRGFPLLYDMTGRWRKPQKVSYTNNELFAWSATDLARFVLPKCVLGHSLKVLEADAEGTIKKRGSSLCDSHSLLLKVLKLKVLEKCLDEEVTYCGFPMPPGDPVPSAVLSRAVKDFRAIARVWLASTKRAASAKSSPTLFTMDDVAGAEAFFVPNLGLQLTISKFKLPVATVENCTCRMHGGKLYVDKYFENDFKRPTEEDESADVQLPVLFTPNSDSRPSSRILNELTRAVFPTSLKDQLSLLHFSKGLLNLWATLAASKLSTESLTLQLCSYLSSHGIPKSSHAILLDSLLRRSEGEETLPMEMDVPAQPPSSSSPATIVSTSSAEASSASERSWQRALEGMGRNSSSIHPYTRYQTHVYDAIAENASLDPRTPSMRSGFLEDEDLFSRAMSSTAALTSAGLEGERAVYLSLQQLVDRHYQNFTFPTGHPDLGNGRLVKVTWLNANGESLMPYDIEIYLEVPGCVRDLGRQLDDAVQEDVIRQVSRGLLRVGPIFVEVKTTTMDESAWGERRRDLFELSISEAAYARHLGWRFHLVRLRQSRARVGQPATDDEMEYIPNLARALQERNSHMKLFVGIQQ